MDFKVGEAPCTVNVRGLLIWSGRTSELFFQVAARIAVRAARYFVRCAAHDHVAALRASFRTEVDDVVGTFYDIHVVFDDDERVAAQDEASKAANRRLMSWKCSPVVGSSKMKMVGSTFSIPR